MDLEPVYKGEKWTLGRILITDESQIPPEFFILEEEKGKWIELKGAKAIPKVGKGANGEKYEYTYRAVSYTHLRAHETVLDLVCRLLLEKKKKKT